MYNLSIPVQTPVQTGLKSGGFCTNRPKQHVDLVFPTSYAVKGRFVRKATSMGPVCTVVCNGLYKPAHKLAKGTSAYSSSALSSRQPLLEHHSWAAAPQL